MTDPAPEEAADGDGRPPVLRLTLGEPGVVRQRICIRRRRPRPAAGTAGPPAPPPATDTSAVTTPVSVDTSATATTPVSATTPATVTTPVSVTTTATATTTSAVTGDINADADVAAATPNAPATAAAGDADVDGASIMTPHTILLIDFIFVALCRAAGIPILLLRTLAPMAVLMAVHVAILSWHLLGTGLLVFAAGRHAWVAASDDHCGAPPIT